MKKIAVIINKSWEADPIINAMLSSKIKPSGFPFPAELNIPKPNPLQSEKAPKQDKSRAIFNLLLNDKSTDSQNTILSVTLWCIEDLTRVEYNSSSSEEKAIQLDKLFSKENSDLVIAVGTAAFNDKITSFNGSVVIGTEFFTCNARPENPESKFEHPLLGEYLQSNLSENFSKKIFSLFNDKFKDVVESKFITPPNYPAAKPRVLASSNYVAISNVNITNYNDYAWADDLGTSKYSEQNVKSPIGSIETTHGVIRLSSMFPTIFISAITDRVGYFNMDVSPSQNYVASFNAGIFLTHFLSSIATVF